ncbi:hypothetical protein DENSPDRAFT_850342 [Dentipellis sp. KUC8613]|nr:hypothetical protein DENSPDRAFT_850342 [Dentipellis sp. KUC8613]
MSEKSEKNFDFSDWSDNMPHAPPAYGRFSPPPGPPPQNPFHQSSGYHSDDLVYSGSRSRGLNDSYYSPPPGDPYGRGSSPYGGPSYAGSSQYQGPPQGYYPSASGYSQNDPSYRDGQQFPGFSYTGNTPHKRDPLNPPPACFMRRPNPQCPYPRLQESIHIPAQDKNTLEKGFMPIFPAPQLLMAHDVQPADLARLLEDCHLISAESVGQKITANVAPLAMGVGFLPGLLVTHGLENRMKRGNIEDAAGLVEVWDEAFFAPRRLRLTMQRGRAYEYNDSSSSDSDSDDNYRHRTSRGAYDMMPPPPVVGYGYRGLVGRRSALGPRPTLVGALRAEAGIRGPGLLGGVGLVRGARMALQQEIVADQYAHHDQRLAAEDAERARRKAERRARKKAKKAAKRGAGVSGMGDQRIYLVISNR